MIIVKYYKDLINYEINIWLWNILQNFYKIQENIFITVQKSVQNTSTTYHIDQYVMNLNYTACILGFN